MRAETVSIDNENALVTPELEAVEAERGFWMRSCPQCNRVLCKSSPDETLRCICDQSSLTSAMPVIPYKSLPLLGAWHLNLWHFGPVAQLETSNCASAAMRVEWCPRFRGE
jgi:hypothetical protein